MIQSLVISYDKESASSCSADPHWIDIINMKLMIVWIKKLKIFKILNKAQNIKILEIQGASRPFF